VAQGAGSEFKLQYCKKKKKRKKNLKIDCGLLTLIILATQEVEIRRIAVQGQPGQIV
jgi:hypothetical protein